MPPRLNHRKSVHGCSRCKRRRVKCDEERPSCGACTRHRVACEYPQIYPGRDHGHGDTESGSNGADVFPYQRAPSSSGVKAHYIETAGFGRDAPNHDPSVDLDKTTLELRLMHYYLMYTSTSFSTAEEMWQHRIPLVAYRNRSVLDGLLALAAGHLFREALAAGDDRSAAPSAPQPSYKKITVDHRAFLAGIGPTEMQKISRDYFQASIQGLRQAFNNDRQPRDYEATFIASFVISFYALFTLGAEDDGDSSGVSDASLWFTLAIGPRQIVGEWRQSASGIDVLRYWGQFDQEPDLSDEEELFRPSHAEPWSAVLSWASEFEMVTQEVQHAYEQTMAYIGLIYKGIVNHSEPPTATCRRIVALPARVPPPFTDMVLQKQPRALVIIAHVFAMMKAVENDIIWFKGTPEKQIGLIHEQLPSGWQKTMRWPLKVLAGQWEGGKALPPPLRADQIAAS